MTVQPFTSHAVVDSGDARVTLAGELDLDTAPQVREAVSACLMQRPTSLRLDLTGVSFCDCAGLTALFRARMSVLRAGVDLAVEGVGGQLARLLSLLGADGVFTEQSARAAPEPTRCTTGPAAADRAAETPTTTEWPLRDLA